MEDQFLFHIQILTKKKSSTIENVFQPVKNYLHRPDVIGTDVPSCNQKLGLKSQTFPKSLEYVETRGFFNCILVRRGHPGQFLGST